MASHSSTLAWRIPWTEEPGTAVHGVAKSRTGLSDFTFTFTLNPSLSQAHTHTAGIMCVLDLTVCNFILESVGKLCYQEKKKK